MDKFYEPFPALNTEMDKQEIAQTQGMTHGRGNEETHGLTVVA